MSPTLGKTRKQLTARQKEILMKAFQAKPCLEAQEKHEFATMLNISKEKVEKWFINKRHSLQMGE